MNNTALYILSYMLWTLTAEVAYEPGEPPKSLMNTSAPKKQLQVDTELNTGKSDSKQ